MVGRLFEFLYHVRLVDLGALGCLYFLWVTFDSGLIPFGNVSTELCTNC